VRNLLTAIAVMAVAIGASACRGTTSGTSATSSSRPRAYGSTTTLPARSAKGSATATETMKAALRHGASQPSLHYVSTSVGGSLSTTIVGDVDQTSGTQTIVVSYKKVRSTILIELVGHEAYFRGQAAAIEVLIGLAPAEAAAAAGRWVSVVPSDSVYQSTAAALTVGSVMSELALTPPITGGRSIRAGFRTAIKISGGWVGEGVSAKDRATGTLQVSKEVESLPIRFDGVVPATATSPRFVDTIAVSRWGEPVAVTRPASAVPLAAISGSVPTTTLPPTVV